MKKLRSLALVTIVLSAAVVVIAPTSIVASAGNASLAVTDVSVSPTSATTGESVTAAATVANNGSDAGELALELTADGTTVATTSIAVGANDSATANLSTTFDDPGTYALAVNGVPGGSVTIGGPHLIDECTTITEPGTYHLVSDLQAPGSAPACIEIAASDVVLDGQGHTIDGTSGFASPKQTEHYGVAVQAGAHRVTVRNLRATEWTHGVDVTGAIGARVTDVTATRNRVGIALKDADATTVAAVRATGNAKHGVRVRPGSSNAVVVDSTIGNNGHRGVFVTRSDGVRIANNAITGNVDGVLVHGSGDVTVSNNRIATNAENGVYLRMAARTTVRGNRIAGGTVGIQARGTHEEGGHESGDDGETADSHDQIDPGSHLIVGNTVTGSGTDGILLDRSQDATLRENHVRNAGAWALDLVRGSDATVQHLRLDRGSVSFRGTDVAVGPTTVPTPTPAGHPDVGIAVEATATSDVGTWADVVVGYDEAAVDDAGVAEDSLHLWHHDGTDWTMPGTPSTWRWDEGLQTWIASDVVGNVLDTDADEISVESTALGIYAPLGGHVTTDAIHVRNASVAPTHVDIGEPVTVTADLVYEGPGSVDVTADLFVDDAPVAATTRTVAAGDPVDVAFTREFDAGGVYDVAVSGTDAGRVYVRDPTDTASFDLITRSWVYPGDLIEVQVDLENTGDRERAYIVDFDDFPADWRLNGQRSEGGVWKATETKWLFQTVAAGESVSPSLEFRVSAMAPEGTVTLSGSLYDRIGELKTDTVEVTVLPERTPKPTPDPTPEPTVTPKPTPDSTPEPTATPEPTPEPTATPEPTPEPTSTPEPTPEPTATPEPTPESTEEPTPAPGEDATGDPAGDVTDDPVTTLPAVDDPAADEPDDGASGWFGLALLGLLFAVLLGLALLRRQG